MTDWAALLKRPLDIDVLIGSFAKVQRDLGWAPRVTLEEGLARTVEYWRTRFTHGEQLSKVLASM